MGYVHKDQPDIFVSYAQVDDKAVPGVTTGWVSYLVQTLEVVLARHLGRREAFELWMDHQLSINAELTPEIQCKVRNSAVLIVILSPGHLASQWCQDELNWFLQEIGRRK